MGFITKIVMGSQIRLVTICNRITIRFITFIVMGLLSALLQFLYQRYYDPLSLRFVMGLLSAFVTFFVMGLQSASLQFFVMGLRPASLLSL